MVSDRPDLAPIVAAYRIGFEHVPVVEGSRAAAEDRGRQPIAAHDIELVVLARYMQIISDRLCEELAGRMINIHRSFLPSFLPTELQGARPYHQAWERGVKIIGATVHYVTRTWPGYLTRRRRTRW